MPKNENFTPKQRAHANLYNYIDRAANSPYGAKFSYNDKIIIESIIDDIVSAVIEELTNEFMFEIREARLIIADQDK